MTTTSNYDYYIGWWSDWCLQSAPSGIRKLVVKTAYFKRFAAPEIRTKRLWFGCIFYHTVDKFIILMLSYHKNMVVYNCDDSPKSMLLLRSESSRGILMPSFRVDIWCAWPDTVFLVRCSSRSQACVGYDYYSRVGAISGLCGGAYTVCCRYPCSKCVGGCHLSTPCLHVIGFHQFHENSFVNSVPTTHTPVTILPSAPMMVPSGHPSIGNGTHILANKNSALNRFFIWQETDTMFKRLLGNCIRLFR